MWLLLFSAAAVCFLWHSACQIYTNALYIVFFLFLNRHCPGLLDLGHFSLLPANSFLPSFLPSLDIYFINEIMQKRKSQRMKSTNNNHTTTTIVHTQYMLQYINTEHSCKATIKFPKWIKWRMVCPIRHPDCSRVKNCGASRPSWVPEKNVPLDARPPLPSWSRDCNSIWDTFTWIMCIWWACCLPLMSFFHPVRGWDWPFWLWPGLPWSIPSPMNACSKLPVRFFSVSCTILYGFVYCTWICTCILCL